jgi:hypothetical protein
MFPEGGMAVVGTGGHGGPPLQRMRLNSAPQMSNSRLQPGLSA